MFFIDAAADKHAYAPKLQESEIADVFWVDVQELFNPRRYQVLSYPLEQSLRKHPRVLAVTQRVLGNMLFDCIYLPRPNRSVPDDDERLSHRDVHDFVLWGMTLRAVTQLFAVTGSSLPMRPTAQRFEKSTILGPMILYCLRHRLTVAVGTATFLSSIVVVHLVN